MHWRDLAEHVRRTVGQVDALIVDAPYSERTHSGHDDGASAANRSAGWTPKDAARAARASVNELSGDGARRAIAYEPWTPDDVAELVAAWSPLVRGWFCSLTDHVLADAWAKALEVVGRYTFAPIACVETGSRVRLGGDGPSQWSTWLVAARPATREFQRWGTLPGAYVGGAEGKAVVGGKPLWLMERLVEDYTRRGDLVCDPCMGAGTTLLAAKLLGRRYIGGDLDESHVEIARERLRDLPAQPKKGTLALPWEKP